MRRPNLFGTDGMRGTFGRPPLDPSTIRRLGAALGARLASASGDPPLLVLGGDTRDSTPSLCCWLAAEIQARGTDVLYLGTVTTPGVTSTVIRTGAACGIAVSASHNPHPDNGVKLIDSAGFKWAADDEVRLEDDMDGITLAGSPIDDQACDAGLEINHDALGAYLASLTASVAEVDGGGDGRSLAGLRIALDLGHGAASPFGRRLFEELGAEVVVVNDKPDGTNINQGCGSTYPDVVAALVREHRCDLGFSFDGDADRVVMADERGEVRDGDAILYLWALDLQARGALPGDAIVATSMSNLGLETALRQRGIELVRCDVGDREVVSTLRRRGLRLGGEQSGHIINLGLSTTGDGLLTALHLASLRARSGRPVSELLVGFERFPQLLRSLRVARRPDLDTLPAVSEAKRSVDQALEGEGRLVLRYSGTEPKVRIMIEGRDRDRIHALADGLETVLMKELA